MSEIVIFSRARRVLLLAVGTLALWAPAGAAAKPLQVCATGCAYSSIADAMSAADSGATIVVAPGTYAGGFAITKNVSLLGAGAGASTISGGIAQFDGLGNFRGNTPVVSVVPGVTATISGFTITGNTAGKDAGGILNAGKLTLRSSIVSGNSSLDSAGGIFNDQGATLTLTSTTVKDNSTPEDGGGIINYQDATLTLVSSIVSNNTAGGGGGISNSGTVMIKSSTITNNTATHNGGGIFSADGVATVTSSNISGNTAAIAGAGAFNSAALVVKNTVITNNTAAQNGGGIANLGSTTLSGSAITANTVTSGTGGGIFSSTASTGATLSYTSTTISENNPDNVAFG